MRTGIKVQRAMFLENLWRQMDRMSASKGKSNIVKAASDYFSEGYGENEIVELLVDDGFDADTAKSCVAMVAEAADGGQGGNWCFEAEDMRGDIVNNHDLGLDGVSGADEKAGMEAAQDAVDSEFGAGQYTVTRVFAR